ncbi:hypothetical protein AC579_7655 [Pseudocercospora musae]|uniref:Uncharacterized protein n=1 Tax=Pseudocercospora musae TaxID=113226 RepID=A0A139I4H5_9PEZI|nr:hypothetical protein AC579_7655 [Pseudocercospora musae]
MAHATPTTMLTHLPVDPKDRPKYNTEQMQQYFKKIKLPQQYLSSPVLKDPSLASTKEHGLPLLRALHLHHLGNVPFENLELHYSAHRHISLNMDDLFDKFVTKGIRYGRGGRCMENNGFFGTALRSLGYDVRNCAGRVSRSWSPNAETREKLGHTYDNWNHMLNLVKIQEQWWVVDVGMGSMGPAIIYPLEDGYEGLAVAPRKIRLQKRVIPEHASRNEDEAPKLWCYDQCLIPGGEGPKSQWISTYCFTETEFLPQDYEMMSYYTSTNPKSFFTYSVMCSKFVLDDARENIIGHTTLFNNSISSVIGGKKEVSTELNTEEERIQKFKEVLGVELTDEEESSIDSSRKLS